MARQSAWDEYHGQTKPYLSKATKKSLHTLGDLETWIGWHLYFVVPRLKQHARWKYELCEIIVK
jgi:hypothetical protein